MKSPALTLAPLCFLFVLMVSAVPLRAQALILRGGMNISNAVRDPETPDPFGQDPRLGFNAALLGDIPAGTYTHVLVGAGYEQRGIQITFGDDDYVLSADYIRTARAKGLPEWSILSRHALRNALLPMITVAGLQFPTLLGGALVAETVFTWPGMGRLFLDSIAYRDYPVVMGILMLSAAMVMLGSLIADLLYAVVDPRIRME